MTETIVNEKYGYRELKNKPTQAELDQYYADAYKAKKLDKPKEKAKADREWLERTVYGDIAEKLKEYNCENILEIGCGNFWLFNYLEDCFDNVVGIEPSCKPDPPFIFNNIEDIHGLYDAVIMINVLEHVLDPDELIKKALNYLKPWGLFICQVPNDFNVLQLATGKEPWWVVSPDHINYFNRKSLYHLLAVNDLAVIDEQSDYPMELFILRGADYIEHINLGKVCHKERLRFESDINPNARREIYRHFAEAEIGRNLLCFAQYEFQNKHDGENYDSGD